jgi:RNA polymerase sigma-B factor
MAMDWHNATDGSVETGARIAVLPVPGCQRADRSTTAEVVDKQRRYFATRDHGLRDDLVRLHAGLAGRLAGRFSRRGEPIDDLTQVAFIGLIQAVDRYDPRAGIAFAPYAIPTILGELKRHFRDRAWSMRVPRRLQELYLEVKAVLDPLTQEIGRSPSIAEIASRIGAPEEDVIEALEAGRNFYTLSLDAPTSDTQGSTDVVPGVVDPDLISLENRRYLLALAEGLSPRTRLVLELRFSKGMTQSDIAEQVGISQMHVSRLLTKALEYMRRRADRASREAS